MATEKVSINLTMWSIHCCSDFMYLSGIADKHPRLGVNANISHTSAILKIKTLSDEVFVCETHNSAYICNWRFVNLIGRVPIDIEIDSEIVGADIFNKYQDLLRVHYNKNIENIKNDLEEIKRLDTLSTLGKEELQERAIKENEELIAKAKEFDECIYIKLNTISRGSKAAYNIGGKVGIIEPYLHVGMFTDTVLYGEELGDDYLDFRYYVGYCSMETYNWSENIKRVVIENIKEYDVMFNKQIIKAGETIVFKRD